MHQSSYEKMKEFVGTNFPDEKIYGIKKVLDVGSMDVNGSYRDLFDSKIWHYVGLDMQAGKNVDLVPKDPYDWQEIEENSFDLVISGQAMEHIDFPWKTFENIARVLKPNAVCCIIVPSAGPVHSYPVDCWRFYPDGMRALCKHAGLKTIFADFEEGKRKYSDDSEKWKDVRLIAAKPQIDPTAKTRNTTDFILRYNSGKSAWGAHGSFAYNLIALHGPKVIVELGVHHGDSYFTFCQACEELELDSKCFGVDSWKGDDQTGFYGDEVFNEVQDYNKEFYGEFSTLLRMDFEGALNQFDDESIELLHVDGSHDYESVKGDFFSWLPKVKNGGLILIHDINVEKDGFGVKKFWNEIRTQFDHKEHSYEHGLGIICKGKMEVSDLSMSGPNNRVYMRFLSLIAGKKGKLLEIGAREFTPDSSTRKTRLLSNNELVYTGCDLTEGKNVDIVCDAHNLTGSFERESFEVVVSHTVFEHLLFPWKVILEINQILRKGGFLWIWTHPAWPQHELPFDYWRYQENSFHGLLNEFTGFEILELEESFPAKLEVAPPFTFTVLDDIGRHPINLGIGVLAKKISDPIETLAWDLLPDDLNAIRKQKNKAYVVRPNIKPI